jgi:GNAT superfamily N-acetyltransferase
MDDLITNPNLRSQGVGHSIMNYCKAQAMSSKHNARVLTLEVPVGARESHRFYHKEGLFIDALSLSTNDFNPSETPDQITQSISLPQPMEIIKLTNAAGEIDPASSHYILAAENIHRQLRPQLPFGNDYLASIKNICSSGPAHFYLICARRPSSNKPYIYGLAITRSYENTNHGYRYYIDDLIVDERRRNLGLGAALINHLRAEAIQSGANQLTLEVAMNRVLGHRFYHKHGLMIDHFTFATTLNKYSTNE